MDNLVKTFEIGSNVVGIGRPTYIIAEACENHFGDMDIAKKMIVEAKKCGCDAIKFQHHLPDEEMLPGGPTSDNFSEPLYDFLKRCSLSIEQHAELRSICINTEIEYLCTPFSYQAAIELHQLGLDIFKIGSGEMTDIPTLRSIATNLARAMIVSTGMSTFGEIDDTYEMLSATKIPFCLLNCLSEYPPKYEDVNLGVIKEMQTRYPNAAIGHSDHTPDIYTSFAAVAMGAVIIEKHVTLDKSWSGPDQAVSIDFSQMAELVEGSRKIEAALGSEKKVHEKEIPIRKWAFRSLVTKRELKKGEILSVDNLSSKRPGTGIPSKDINRVVGKKVIRSLSRNTLLKETDFE